MSIININILYIYRYLYVNITKVNYIQNKVIKGFVIKHDPITYFLVCSKNERFDHSFNIFFSLILYLAIIIVKVRVLNYLL